MNSLLQLILTVLDIYFFIIIAMVVMSWLIGFNIINANNDFVRQVRYALHRLTEPLLGPIRRLLPDLGGLDVSPIILVLGIVFLQNLIREYGSMLL